MKKIHVFLVCLLFQIVWAQNSFELGNTAYQNGNYQEAISHYESIINSGKESAEVYFNLGNCYYKLRKVAPAIYNYEKALLLKPTDEEIKTNLEFAQKMTIDDIKVIPKVGFHKLIADFTSTFHFNTWAWIAIVLAFAFFMCFLGYYFSGTALKKRIFFAGMSLMFLLILLSIGAALFEKNRFEQEQPAIIFAESTLLKNEPKISATDVVQLHEGTKVYILESIANWKKVALTDDTTGWIENTAIKELK